MAAVLAYPSSVLSEVVPYDVGFSGDGAYEYAASAHDMGIVSVPDGLRTYFISNSTAPRTGNCVVARTRLTADGSPDITFNGDGLRRDALNGWACSNDAALDASGKLLVAVQTTAGMAVVRYTNSGARD